MPMMAKLLSALPPSLVVAPFSDSELLACLDAETDAAEAAILTLTEEADAARAMRADGPVKVVPAATYVAIVEDGAVAI
jgi:Lon protease-like protein